MFEIGPPTPKASEGQAGGFMFTSYYGVRDWLESFIPLVWGKEELGLVRIRYLLKLLGNPEKRFKSIHVAGTSGKGSTAFYIARILQIVGPVSSFVPVSAQSDQKSYRKTVDWADLRAAGGPSRTATLNLKIGLHISPHLVDIRERMQIFQVQSSKFKVQSYNRLMPMGRFLGLMNEIKPVVEKIQKEKPELTPSYFEILTAAAFKYFAEEKVDWAVVEVGLGGRLDATNVLKPEVSVITNIGLDHTEILGNTIEKIAFEKAGIIKNNTPVVTGATGQALEVIEKVAREKKAKLVKVKGHSGKLGNFEIAQAAVGALGVGITDSDKAKVLSEGFAGRFEEIDTGPTSPKGPRGVKVILDGAHNPDKVRSLIEFVRKLKVKSGKFKIGGIILVIAFKKGKDWKKMIDLLVKRLPVRQIVATEFQAVTDTGMFAAVDPEEICDYVAKVHNAKCKVIRNSQEAVFEAIKNNVILNDSEGSRDSSSATQNDSLLVLVTGSLYLIGEVRTMWHLPEF